MHAEQTETRLALDGVEGDVQKLIVSCNKDGMVSLRQGETKAAFEQFKYAEALLLANQLEGDTTSLLATTCNNLGCYYKKIGKYHGSLSYLRRALKLEVELNTDEVTLAGTHLNLCAVLSKLEKHDKAVQHALVALELMQARISLQNSRGGSQDDYTVLAIAYHNVGIEREFMEQWDQAATSFRTGFEVAKRFLGESHALSITMSNNCDAVLRRARQIKVRPSATRRTVNEESGRVSSCSGASGDGGLVTTGGTAGTVTLPPITLKKGNASSRNAARNEALEWAKKEEELWASFAQKTLQGSGIPAAEQDIREEPEDEEFALKPQPLTAAALVEMQDLGLIMPQAYDMGLFRFPEKPTSKGVALTSLQKALDEHPQALMDIVDAEQDGEPSKTAANDFRPNRSMKRSTRTARVVRRTGVFNTTVHRDKVTKEKLRMLNRPQVKAASSDIQNLAATKIQRVYRAWYRYCQENSEWITVTSICATMIQSHWRSYHVRRLKLDSQANKIQKRVRGMLIRRALKWHKAAVTIQKRLIGILTRMKLQRLHKAATQIQRLVRGGLARRRYRRLHRFKVGVIITIQRYVRVWLAKCYTQKLREEKRFEDRLQKATTDLQRMFRGWKGRERARSKYEQFMKEQRRQACATRIQSLYRSRKAKRRVEDLRDHRYQEMERAATLVRKVYLASQTRRKFLKLKEDFKAAEGIIIVIQRYMRGCLLRNRLWKEAVQREEHNWAVIEIQRHWRGYRGRVRFEETLEKVWRREMAAVLLQRNLRGWIVRLKVSRERRKIARAEFERARARFYAAQRIQALVRGLLVRKVQLAKRARCRRAATQIQRVHRGAMVRTQIWRQVRQQRAVIIQAAIRGYLVRARRRRLLHKTLAIQRFYRYWLRKHSVEKRSMERARIVDRKQKAALIQRHFRQFSQRRLVKSIIRANAAAAA